MNIENKKDNVNNDKANMGIKVMQLSGQSSATIELWDLPHSLRMHSSIFTSYLQGVNAIVFVYSCNEVSSVDDMQAYYTHLKEKYDGNFTIPAIVLGTMSDCRPTEEDIAARSCIDMTKIVEKRATDWTTLKGLTHHHVSAKSNEGIQEAFKNLLLQLLTAHHALRQEEEEKNKNHNGW